MARTALVLEGGAMRGMYTAGVLDVMMEAKVPVDLIVGVSAGAAFGVNYLSGQKGRVIRYNKRFVGDKRYIGMKPLLKERNLISPSFAYGTVPFELDVFDDEAFMASGVPFYAVVTRVDNGKPEYHLLESGFRQMDLIRASGSMPFVSTPVKLNGVDYLDGGISDSVPFKWAATQGCEKMVVILTRDMSYRKTPMSPFLIKLFYGRKKALARQLLERHDVYNRAVEELAEWEKQGKAFVIRPSAPIEIGRMEKDPEKLQQVYDLGIKDGQTILADLKAYLEA